MALGYLNDVLFLTFVIVAAATLKMIQFRVLLCPLVAP